MWLRQQQTEQPHLVVAFLVALAGVGATCAPCAAMAAGMAVLLVSVFIMLRARAPVRPSEMVANNRRRQAGGDGARTRTGRFQWVAARAKWLCFQCGSGIVHRVVAHFRGSTA